MTQFEVGNRVAWAFRCTPTSKTTKFGRVVRVGRGYVVVRLEVPEVTCGHVMPLAAWAVGKYLQKIS